MYRRLGSYVQKTTGDKPGSLDCLGAEFNVLIMGHLRQGTGDWTTAHRIRQYFDFSQFSWVAKDVNNFEDREMFREYLSASSIHCVIGINALTCARLLLDCPVPYALIMSGPELAEASSNLDRYSAITVAINNSEFIISRSQYISEQISKTLPFLSNEKKLHIPQAVITRPVPKLNLTGLEKTLLGHNSTIFVMVTKLNQARDPLYIVPAFTYWHQMNERHPYLVIIGHRTDAEYSKKFTAIIDGCPGVVYIGSRNVRETHRFIADSFALVSTSSAAGTCTAILEAMDLGVPVLLRRNPCHASLVEDGVSGLLYSSPEICGMFGCLPDAYQDFISKASQLLQEPSGRGCLTDAARQRVADHHSASAEKESFTRLVRDLKTVLRLDKDRGQVGRSDSQSEESGGGAKGMEANGKPHVRFMLPGGKQVTSSPVSAMTSSSVSANQRVADSTPASTTASSNISSSSSDAAQMRSRRGDTVPSAPDPAGGGPRIPRWKQRQNAATASNPPPPEQMEMTKEEKAKGEKEEVDAMNREEDRDKSCDKWAMTKKKLVLVTSRKNKRTASKMNLLGN